MTKLTKYHAVLLDETGCEFGADCEAKDRAMAWAYFREAYPESRPIQVESYAEADERERRMRRHIERGGDYDDEGRPIFHYPDWD